MAIVEVIYVPLPIQMNGSHKAMFEDMILQVHI